MGSLRGFLLALTAATLGVILPLGRSIAQSLPAPTNVSAAAVDSVSVLVSWEYSGPQDGVQFAILETDGPARGRTVASHIPIDQRSFTAIQAGGISVTDGTRYCFSVAASRYRAYEPGGPESTDLCTEN
jgi:hypothetical protein